MKNKLIFILWLLMFSFFSCDFGIKENEETNSKEYFTVKGSCSIQGAIPSDLLPEKSIKQNAQRTVVPNIETDVITVIFESETKETKTAEVVNNDGVLNFEVELPAGKWTVKAQGKKSDVVIIKSESCQIELSAENKSENVALVLKPTQSDTGEGFFEFSFGQIHTKVSGMKYTYKKNGSTESQSVIIDNFPAPKNIELSSGVYTFRFDFYSDMDCTDELLYSFTEVVNIFDGLTTDTWISAGEYIDGGNICITNDMISKFVSTTVYVSEFGDDSNFGTFFAPVTTIQKAVDKVIAMNVDTASSEGNPYKILLLGNIETLSDDSFENNNNALVNIDPSSASEKPLYLTISNYGDGNATINANRSSSNTGRVMYIGKNANVTLQNLILTGGYLTNDENEKEKGAGLYILNNDANVKIENSEITGNVIDNGYGAGLHVGHNTVAKSLNLTIENSKISNNTIKHDSAGALIHAGAGIAIENVEANITITDSVINSNKINQDGIANTPEDKGVGLWLGNSAVTTISNSTISENKIEKAASTNKNAGGGICIDGGTLTINGDTIISDNLSGYGGGVCIFGGNFTMSNGAEISNCTGDYAGGIIIYTGGTFTMNDGATISTCTSLQYGGGVGVYDSADGTFGAGGTFTMSGGTISGCTAGNGCGDGVYVEKGTFTMNGGAVITSNNDVYLTEDQKITITEKLSTNNVTTITPQSYAENKKVLDAGDDVKLSEQQVGMFKVTQSDKFKTEITDEGCLKNTLNKDTNLNADLYEICSTIYVYSADGMKAISDLSQTKDEVEGKDFAGKTIILEEAVELASDYELIKTFSGVFEGNSKTITLTKPDSYDSDKYFGGAIFNVITGENAEVRNLDVYGEAYIAGIAIELENDAVILNCNNFANITSPNGAAVHGCGGIVGELSNGGFIENCKNEGTISYNSTNDKGCGGIVGVISSYSPPDKGNSIIANCINTGEIKRVQKEGNVEDDVSIGGICGEVKGNAAIYNCVNKGSVTSELTDTSVTENIGGITGYCSVSFYEGEFPSLPENSIPDDMGIFNCYNSGTISSSYSSDLKYIGGIVGKGYVGFANSLYYTIRVTNTVNNDGTTFAFGNINISNNSVEFDIKNNFYINASTDTKYPLYESTFHGVNNSVVNTLNDYSDETGRPYLQWRVDLSGSGNIIFLE